MFHVCVFVREIMCNVNIVGAKMDLFVRALDKLSIDNVIVAQPTC